MAYGRWDNGRAELAPVLAHMADLQAAGMSLRRITALAGTNSRWACNVRHNPNRRWVSRRISNGILAIPIPAPGDLTAVASSRSRVDATGTARRLQALMAIGYTQREVIERLGTAPTMSYRLWEGGRLVMACTAQKVCALYDELAMVQPPDTWQARRAARRAAERGWAPPLAWDDESIDDPEAKPHPWQPQPLTSEEFAEVVADYRRSSYGDEAIAAKLGIQVESLYRRLDRLGVPRSYGRSA